MHPLGAGAELAHRLRAPQGQHGQEGDLGPAEAEGVVEDLAVLGHPGARRVDHPGEPPLPESGERDPHGVVVVGHHRIAVGQLVAGGHHGVLGEGVAVGGGELLLHEAGDDPQLFGGEGLHRPKDI